MYILFKITNSKSKVGKKSPPTTSCNCELLWGKQKEKILKLWAIMLERERERESKWERGRERQWEKKTSRLHETQLTSSTKLPPDHYKNHLIANHFVRSIDSNWKNNKKLIMLQMRPWKMSLLLGGNNNSKFQLLLTLQSSVFSSDRIYCAGESEYAPIDWYFF